MLKPSAAALPDLSLGVVATRVALENNIISLKDSNSEKLNNKSIRGSSISSFLVESYSMKVSIEKPGMNSSKRLEMCVSIWLV